MRRLIQVVLLGISVLGMASLATAQQVPQPMVRLGNLIEVGNDVFMKIMASADIRYHTTENWDFDNKVRDRPGGRFPDDGTQQDAESDLTWAELRLGVEARYQKNLTLYLLFEHQQNFDGNLIDDRSNSTNPGGTDVFGRPPATENPGFHTERYWIDYKFQGTPLRMRVGADLWTQDQAGLVGDDDPRFAVFLDLGNFDVTAAAVYQMESQRLGLENDNDFIYYTFSGGYTLKPHRFQLDVTYFRDRFLGADTQSPVPSARGVVGGNAGPVGFQGQKTDSYLIMGSWSGRLGPVRALIQGNILTGTARGGTNVAGLPAGVKAGQHYDIFAGGVVAYAEADLGIVRPFVGFVYGSGDGDPTDHQLHGFMTLPTNEITLITGTPFFEHLDPSTAFQLRDYSYPARAQGVRTANTLGGSGIPGNPFAIGAGVLGNTVQGAHTTGNPFNDRIGNTSHLGIATTYSNPGTFDIPVGIRTFPLKGHEITGWFVNRQVVSSGLLDRAFIKGVDPGFNGHIRKSLYNEFGGFWMWTLNPYFDIRVQGNIGIPDGGYRDLGRLANCNLGGPREGCTTTTSALKGDIRFRARF
jgi:hypothetical protein